LPSQIIEKKGRGKEIDIHRQGNRSQKRKRSIDHGKGNVLGPALSFSVHSARNGKRGRLPNMKKWKQRKINLGNGAVESQKSCAYAIHI
jgi:hypothetical protein